MRQVYIGKYDDLKTLHITKFKVINGYWIGEVGEKEGVPVIYCKTSSGDLVNTFPITRHLDIIVEPLKYEDKVYEEIELLKEQVDNYQTQLLGQSSILSKMTICGYTSEEIIKIPEVAELRNKLGQANNKLRELLEVAKEMESTKVIEEEREV